MFTSLFYYSVIMKLLMCLRHAYDVFASHQMTCINIGISIGCSIPTTFFIVSKLQTALILKLVPGTFFAGAKTIRAFVDTNQLLMIKMVAGSNAST